MVDQDYACFRCILAMPLSVKILATGSDCCSLQELV